MKNNSFDELLLGVEKPSRYLGTEVNAVRQGKKALNFLLAFPDTYEVGMSHLGLQILYSILNSLPEVKAERCFAPWPDREKQLRLHNLPLSSLESRTPLGDFDVIGFSLQYELSYTNVLNMLDMGNIPLHTRDRNNNHPLIIAGGPCCFNPAPLSSFIDAFVIGEGEEIISEISAAVIKGNRNKLPRANILENLALIPGIYVPSLHKKDQLIKKRTIPDLNQWRHPQKPVVPLMQAVHDRIVMEIARGCTRGCRFCQAGMIWRPYRERDSSLLLDIAQKALQATGHDEISLLSLSAGDYTCIEGLMQNLIDKYFAQRIAVALPSLRVESLNDKLIESIKRVRKTSFTLAPEAGTDKMRKIINKGNTSEDLLATIDKVFSAGWKSIKLYFMIGLPGEEQEDLEGIIDLSHAAVRAAKNRGQLTISLSTFVPKPHTPFQWEEQISLEETYKRQDFIRRHTKNRRISFKWHDARMSFLEGIFSRGDETIGLLLEKAFNMGCRFDGWSEIFLFDLWQKALQETGIDASQFLRERGMDEALPWDNIDCGVSRDFLLEEKQKAHNNLPTPDCRFDECQLCGVCDFSTTKNIFSTPDESKKTAQPGPAPDALNILKNTYRFAFRKVDRAKFLSHLEISAALNRALRQCGFPLFYSSGFHPHPKISFGTATAVGTESFQEYMDVGANQTVDDFISLKKAINIALPSGLEIDEIKTVSPQEKSLAEALHGFFYEFILPENFDNKRLEIINDNIDKFTASSVFNISRLSKGVTSTKNIRPFVENIMLDFQKRKIKCSVLFSQKGSARATDIITHVAGLTEAEGQKTHIVKTKTILK
jgi:radical SAM family uncharacterized protein/radical SAM-linked protein